MLPISFGRYVLVQRIAAGGMGEVYLAVPRTLWGFEKFFAIKKVLPTLSSDPEFLSRFRDEARLVIPMNHPNVVQVFEVGRVEEDYFIAMELVEGQSLGGLLTACWERQQVLPVAAALYMVRELLAGLEYCHRRTDEAGRQLGMVHRDVSPTNVLVSYDGRVKLADFGLALSSLKVYHTRPNLILGHLGYIAPEALGGLRQDQRADIFSAGVLLFELLTGQRFCPSPDPAIARQQLRARAQVRPSSLRAAVPSSVDRLVLGAVAYNPLDRYQSARAFHEAIQKELVSLDPFFGAAALADSVMGRLFDVEGHRRQIRELVRGLDLDEIEARQPAGRTFCIGEAIPLQGGEPRKRFGPGAAVLTMLGDLSDGDTEPLRLRPDGKTPRPVVTSCRGSVPRAGVTGSWAGRPSRSVDRGSWRRRRWLTPAPSVTRPLVDEPPGRARSKS